MFGRIVSRYDMLNRVMSFGMDRRWRSLAAAAAEPAGEHVLDVGTGTGDLAQELYRHGAAHVVGADFSAEMLREARVKAVGAQAVERGVVAVSWVLADGLRLPFRDGTFGAVTNAFVLRNLEDLRAGLCEMVRVLRPGGRLVCLDMTPPPGGPFGAVYRFYFNRLMPPVAGFLSGDVAAYRYLPNSLTGFPSAAVLAGMLADVGLCDVHIRRLAGATVALHTGRKG